MLYIAITQRLILLPLAFLMLSISLVNVLLIQLVSIMLFILIIFCALLVYETTFNDEKLHYTVRLFDWVIYSKQLSPNDIEKIVYKRTSGLTPLILIYQKEGGVLRVSVIKPKISFQQLLAYSAQYDIAIEKTRDFRRIKHSFIKEAK